MKQIILVLVLIFLASCQDKDGPANNIETRNYDYCVDHLVYEEGSGTFTKEDFGVSGCIDLKLYNNRTKKYFDKCCYVRFMKEGEMYGGCVGLYRDNIIDITETIRRMEEGDRNIWTRYGANSKIYELDCKASYTKFFTVVFVLLSLLF